MTDDWRPMREALYDGRHLILQLDPEQPWGKYAKIKRWRGGVVGNWQPDEDHWEVWHDPGELGNGTLTTFDSRWFTGWKHLPETLSEDEPVEAEEAPEKAEETP